jgi:hypothetical protein
MSDYNTDNHEAFLDFGTIWITDKVTGGTSSLEARESGDLEIDPIIIGEIYDFYYENGE